MRVSRYCSCPECSAKCEWQVPCLVSKLCVSCKGWVEACSSSCFGADERSSDQKADRRTEIQVSRSFVISWPQYWHLVYLWNVQQTLVFGHLMFCCGAVSFLPWKIAYMVPTLPRKSWFFFLENSRTCKVLEKYPQMEKQASIVYHPVCVDCCLLK